MVKPGEYRGKPNAARVLSVAVAASRRAVQKTAVKSKRAEHTIAQLQAGLEIAPSGKCGNPTNVAIADPIGMQDRLTAFAAPAILPAAAVLTALLIIALGPWLTRYAVAKPNACSSHKVPTPQGAGIAVVGTTILVSGGALFF